MSESEPTRVYLTVDVECAEERVRDGQLQPAVGYDVRVFGRLRDQPRELGIGLIMDELERVGSRGTFYVEPIGAHSFGKEGLRETCTTLCERGHDVQLHLHPSQRNAFWHSRGEERAPDDVGAYSEEEQANLLREGMDLLVEAGVPRNSLRSFRAGNFGAANSTWAAMAKAGLTLSSNYNPCYFDLNCAMRTPEPQADLFQTDIDGVWEAPMGNVIEPSGGFRHMQIAAASLSEMKHCLRQSRASGIKHVVFLTHSFELFRIDSAKDQRGQSRRLLIRRLRGLLDFINNNKNDFTIDTMGSLAAQLPVTTSGVRTYPTEPRTIYIGRLVEQAAQRLGVA